MNVVILGGYGVFGGRLAQLLIRDGCDVWIAGRDHGKAEAFCRAHGGEPLSVDIDKNLMPILQARPDIVVDAAGPFQAFRRLGYKVAEFCIAHSIHYLDLSDDADFTASITTLDEAAKRADCFVLSGVSSVPAISSSAVSVLSSDMDRIELIETAIMPGNRAPRGRSVMYAILSQIGAQARLWRGRQWRTETVWSDRRTYSLALGIKRDAWLIRVPDVDLFPSHFSAASVVFRAGLELPVMNMALLVISWLRRFGFDPSNRAFIETVRFFAGLLEPFGSDVGGMVVAVTGRAGDATVRRQWTLTAQAGSGPFVPAVAARAVIRKLPTIQQGARPCLSEVPLDEIELAMNDLDIEMTTQSENRPPLFQRCLEDRWEALPRSVRELHSIQDVHSFSGRAKVTRGRSLVARFAAFFFGFPKEGGDVALTITKTRTEKGEVWERNFNGRVFRSYLTPSSRYRYFERFWVFNYEQNLPVIDGVMHLPVRRGWFLGIPLPKFLLPGSDSREFDIDGVFHFDVGLSAPFGQGLIVRYQGSVTPDVEPLDE